MGFPRKYKKLIETELKDVGTPYRAQITYAVCATEKQSCGWGGWMLESIDIKPTKKGQTLSDCKIDGIFNQICPKCGGVTFRTGATVKMDISEDQTPDYIEGVDYEAMPIEYGED